jgi:hypothetical protein
MLFTACTKLEHFQLDRVYFSPENVESLCRGLTKSASHLQSLGLDLLGDFEENIEEKNTQLLLTSLPPSLKVDFVILYYLYSHRVFSFFIESFHRF